MVDSARCQVDQGLYDLVSGVRGDCTNAIAPVINKLSLFYFESGSLWRSRYNYFKGENHDKNKGFYNYSQLVFVQVVPPQGPAV